MAARPPTTGMSLVGVLILFALIASATLILAKLIRDGMLGAASSQRRQDISTLKMTLRDNLDCLETFDIAPGTALPVPCPAGPIVLRGHSPGPGKRGPELAPGGKLGDWAINPRCENGELVIGLADSGVDPMTKRPWTTFRFAKDLFEGTSDFCKGVVGSPVSCPPGRRPLDLGGTLQCVEVQSLCTAMGFPFDAAKGRCIPIGDDVFGGMFQRGEKSYDGPNCETANPRTGECSCPPGFKDYAQNTTCEPPGCSDQWDQDHFCMRYP